jgi:hypothetical protein
MSKGSADLRIGLMVLGWITLSLLVLQGLEIMLHGAICNYSTKDIWLTVSGSGRQRVSSLGPGQCTDLFTQDADAIWGNDCTENPCRYQAWKVGAGRFDVRDDERSTIAPVLRIDGWGAGSRWRISEDWPRPNLDSVNYSLVR